MEEHKKFLIIGNMNAITYKEVFPYIKNNEIWSGYKCFGGGMDMIQTEDTFDETKTKSFKINDNGEIIKNIMGCIWFTNLDHNKRHQPLDLYKRYYPEEFPHYDNYDAIEVSKTCDIPLDYEGIMGVPITFLDKYCPSQFEIVKFRKGDDDKDLSVNGKCPYFRILIKRISDNTKRDYLKTLTDYGKKFLIIGNMNAITYKEVFPYIKNNEIWLGATYFNGGAAYFYGDASLYDESKVVDPKHYYVQDGFLFWRVNGVRWFTNLDHNKRHQPLDLYKRYYPEEFPHYDNYNAIEVSKVCDIPLDYEGIMGTPITFLDKYCPSQFEIVGITENADYLKPLYIEGCEKYDRGYINGKRMYSRLLIKRISDNTKRDYLKTLTDYGKKFLIIGNSNAITYKEVFPYIKNNEIWLGVTLFCGKMPYFEVSLDTDVSRGASHYYKDGKLFKQINSIAWYTNLDHKKRHQPLDLYKHYYPEEFPHYDNYDAIEVSKVCDIPLDYEGIMGVPITFLDKYCPSQFEIVDLNPHFFSLVEQGFEKPKQLTLHNAGKKDPYARVLIKRISDNTKRDYLKTLTDYNKKFLIIGNMNAITYKEVFPYIKNNEMWLGVSTFNQGMYFIVDDDFEYAKSYKFDKERNGQRVSRVASICWFTNLDHKKRHQPLDLYKRYYPEEFPHYDNYDAIEVSKVCDIPLDYEGVMGVPITFLDKYCPSQFEIVGIMSGAKGETFTNGNDGRAKFYVNDKGVYARVLIKHV